MIPSKEISQYTDRGSSWLSQIRILIRAKVFNLRPRERGRTGRLIVLLVFGGLLCWGAFRGSLSGTRFLLNIDESNLKFGFLITRRLVELSMLFLFSVLGVSSLISALTGFFLARDLQLLHTLPIRPLALYFARLWEVVLQSSWIMVPLILPSLWGMGVSLNADPSFYVFVPIAVFGLVIPICAFAVILVTIVSCVVPASRVREFFMVASGFLFVGIYLIVRAARPEQFIYPDKFKTVPLLLEQLGVTNPYLPSAWASDVLFWSAGQNIPDGTRALVSLLCFTVASLVVGFVVHQRLYIRAKSRTVEIKSTPTKRAEWLVSCFVFFGSLLGRKGLDRAMIGKEAKLILRDPQQWTQILMLLALLVLFAYNFSFFNELGLPNFVEMLLWLGITGFVLSALGARFVFPMVSLEGTAFWILRTAPISTSKILSSKAWSAFIVLEALALLMAVSAGIALEFGWLSTIAGVVLVTPIAIFAAVLGVGLGGSYPRFNFENPMMIPMSYGGMIYVYWSMATLFVYCFLLAWPLYTVYNPLALSSSFAKVLTLLLAGIAFALPFLSGWIAFKMGCHRLEEAFEK